MDVQENASSGANSSDSGLDEVSAFSAYTGAIERISHQYSLWEEAQDEFHKYQEMHKTAEKLAKSIGHEIQAKEFNAKQNLRLLPFASDGEDILKTAQEAVRELQQLTQRKIKRLSENSADIEKLRIENSEVSQKLKRLPQDLKNSLNKVSCENEDERVEIQRKLDLNASELNEIYSSMVIFGIVGFFLFIFFYLNFFGDPFKGIFSSSFFSSLLIFVVFGCINLFPTTISVYILYFFYSIITNGIRSKPQSDLSLADVENLEYRMKIILGDRVKSENFARNSTSDLERKYKETVVSIEKNISKLESQREILEASEVDIINDLEQKALEILREFSKFLAIAREIALETHPAEFALALKSQNPILGSALEYWEHGHGNTPRMLARPWHDSAWKLSYQPQLDGKAPDCVCIGRFLIDNIDITKNQSAKQIEVPAMVPVRAIQDATGNGLPGHIVIFSDVQTRKAAIQVLEAIAVRLLSTFPVRKLKGSFIDPVALGSTFPFKKLPKSMLSGKQIFTNNQEIREELKILITHVGEVIQNHLSGKYKTLEAYNADSQAITEAYRYLFIADFPTAFDQQTSEQLKSIITNGSQAGVYTIIHVDTSKPALRDFDYNLFDQHCTVIRSTDRIHNSERLFELKMPNDWKRDLILDRPPSQEIHQHIIQAIIAAEKTVKVETVPFSSLYPEALWQANSQQELRAPIGLTGARDRIEFWLGENDEKLTVSSGLLAGKPGAGKSYTLHSIILSLAMQYGPDELELYLLDYKEGVEFQIYVDPNRSETTNPNAELDETRALPHAKVISIESDREFGLSVLQFIHEQIETRARIFKDVGVNELKDYRQKTNQRIPRILVVIDEFQYMFQENDPITTALNKLYEDIIRRGRSFGVHLLLASQSLKITNINRIIYDLIPLRMAMQMDQNTAEIVLAPGNTDAIELLDRSGRIIYNTEFGRKRQNQIGQIADISLEERRNAMNHICQKSETSNYQRTQPLTIFQGNRPSKISQNGQLLNLTKLDNWLTSSALNKQVIHSQDWIPQEAPAALWLGEAMRIGRHTHAILRRRARSNMLLIGQSEQSIFGLLSGALLSLAHIYQPTKAEFHIIDLSQTDDDEALSEMTDTFRQSFQDLYPIKLGKRFPNADRGIKRAETILSELHEELQRRQEIRQADPDAMEFGPSVFFVGVIGALNRAQNLRPVAGKRADEMSPDAQKLQEIATIGPELGIHTILWFDNAKTFQQLCVESPRNLLMQFDCRAVLHLPGDDSRLFLGDTIAEKLPALRAYYYDAGLSTGFEKFKPYAIPSQSEIQQYAQNLKQRQL
jgi:DNA segregation ATPase FtsK/SpoIIIE, S-DNA-T family